MQIIKLTILTLFIALPVFMLSALDAQAATHECADTVGVCNYVFSSGVKTYKATPVFDKVDQRYEWNCGFGNGQVSCPEEPATSVSPTPTPPPSSGGNTPPTTSKGNQTQAVEGTYLGEEETITKIVDRCPCPTCGDKHYECIAGKGSTLGASAKNKKETKSQFTGPDGIRRNVTTWTWRCIDSCGNLTGECREEKQDVADPECDESQCVNTDDCSKCANCKVGSPVITSSVNGECKWRCENRDKSGVVSATDYCSSKKISKRLCGNGHGNILTEDPYLEGGSDKVSLSGPWRDNIVGWLVNNYIGQNGRSIYENIDFCGPGSVLCEIAKYSKDKNNNVGEYQIVWYCCPSPADNPRKCSSYEKRSNQCTECSATLENAPPTDLRKYIITTTGTTLETTTNPTVVAGGGNITATVGVGLFKPSSWY